VRVFGWRTRKEKTIQEASGESKISRGGRMNAGFVWHRISRKVVTVIFSRRMVFIG